MTWVTCHNLLPTGATLPPSHSGSTFKSLIPIHYAPVNWVGSVWPGVYQCISIYISMLHTFSHLLCPDLS
jgi:hypothetical protein